MSLYDDGNPQHLDYRDRWRAVGNRVTVELAMKDELKALRDTGVIRATGMAIGHYGRLVEAGLATAKIGYSDDVPYYDYRLTDAGRRAASE